jgi:hypothetical protein
MRWQSLRLQNRDRNRRKTDADAANDARNEHLPVSKRRGLDCGADNDNEVGEDDGAFASYLLAEDESNYGTQGAPYVVDGCDETGHCGVGVAECVFEACAAQDATEKTLVIL